MLLVGAFLAVTRNPVPETLVGTFLGFGVVLLGVAIALPGTGSKKEE